MAQPESCEGCSHAHNCSKVYEQLGCTEGPSVAWAAVLAFVAPIVVFVATLGGFAWLLEDAVADPCRTPLAAALALAATTGVMLVVRHLIRPHRKK
jgi:hypothetical protein